jgi:predicted aldo/keto reductase-like oxidoreductase
VQFRPFGRTGIQTSVLGFGAMRLPTHEDGTCDLDKSVPLLRRGLDLGINYFDSAHVYLKGTSETAVGQAIKGYGRETLHLATKIPVHEEEDAKPAAWRTKFEESLRRFDTPYIDLILFHSLRLVVFKDYVSRPGMALDEARKAQSEGLVRHIGFSSHDTTENVINLINTGEFAAMLVQYNYLDRHNEPAIAHAAEKGMGVAIMGPVAGGRLATPAGVIIDTEGVLEMKTPELALRFVWNNPNVSVALSGMNGMAQIEENVAATDHSPDTTAAENALIQDLIEKNQKLSDLYCTGCGYCMPCPNEVNIPENFRYMNWYRVWGMEKEAKQAYARLRKEGAWTAWAGRVYGLKADECLKCGECEPSCPQNIPIIEQLQEVAAKLGE